MREIEMDLDVAPVGGPRRTRAWVAVLALLVSLVVATGSGSQVGAQESPPDGPAVCEDGELAQGFTLPSGATQELCYVSPSAAGGSVEATTSAEGAAIELAKTVGTDGDACATTDAITVPADTLVFYCYTVENTGSVTVSVHDLEDDQLGTILSDLAYELGPGASTFVTASATIASDTTNIATWTATDGLVSAVSTDTATVTVATAALPSAPSITGVTVAEGKATVTWTAPVDDGGSAITGYVITPLIDGTPQASVDAGPEATSLEIDGLVNGTTYTFTVAATNDIGTGPASAASAQVTPQWWLPWSSGTVAVNELHTWFTGVPPTPAQRTSWLAQLDAGTALPGDLVVALRRGTDGVNNVDPTVRLYSAYLSRVPDASGLNFWLNRRRAGWTLFRISSFFADSSEFENRYGSLSNRAFVELIYQNVLERQGDPAGIDYWTRQLDTRRRDRGQVMINFSESSEFIRKQAENVDAAVVFIHLRGITPSTAARDAFADALRDGEELADLVRQQIHVPAFANRAG